MGIGIGMWSLSSGDSFESGGTMNGNVYINGNLTANTYYSGSTPLETIIDDMITDYVVPESTGYTFDSIGMAISDETSALTSGTTKLSFRMPYDFILTGATAYLVTSGSTDTIVDINYSGGSIFNSPITISAGTFYQVSDDLSISALTEHELITVDIDVAGTDSTGLKVWLEGLRLQEILGNSSNPGDITRVQPGTNITTGGTENYPIVSTVDSPFFNDITFSGTGYGGDLIVNSLSANNITFSGTATGGDLIVDSLSANTMFSGGTSLETIIQTIAGSGGGGPSGLTGQFMIVYTAGTYSWVAPAGVQSVVLEMWGAGGGGGGGGIGSSTNPQGGGGGSSGAYILGTVNVVPGDSYTITVGSKGIGGYNTHSPQTTNLATSGGSSTFGSLLTAYGGNPGSNAIVSAGGGGPANGATATYHPDFPSSSTYDIINQESFIFVRGYNGENGKGVPATSESSGGAGGDAPIYSRNKYYSEFGGTGGNTPNTVVQQVGGSAFWIGGGGAGGTGSFVSEPTRFGFSGGNGSDGLIILRYNAAPNTSSLFTGGTIVGDTNVNANLSANTIYSGSTNLSDIFLTESQADNLYATKQQAYDFMAAASDEETQITTGTSKISFFAPRNFTLTAVTATLSVSGSTTSTIDLNLNGASILPSGIDLISGIYYQTENPSSSAITQFDRFSVDILDAGTDAAGLKVMLHGYT
jgi:hypothetical protein